jgi:uridylate kinase
MGMLATCINGLAICSALQAIHVKARLLTAIRMEPIGEFFSKEKAIEYLEKGEVVVFAAGTGCPYFTTDTGASLKAIEIEADVLLKGTRVDGIYTADPEKDPEAIRFDRITYDEIYQRNLRVMDLTATTLCRDNHLSLIVFNMDKPGNLINVLKGKPIGTLVNS